MKHSCIFRQAVPELAATVDATLSSPARISASTTADASEQVFLTARKGDRSILTERKLLMQKMRSKILIKTVFSRNFDSKLSIRIFDQILIKLF